MNKLRQAIERSGEHNVDDKLITELINFIEDQAPVLKDALEFQHEIMSIENADDPYLEDIEEALDELQRILQSRWEVSYMSYAILKSLERSGTLFDTQRNGATYGCVTTGKTILGFRDVTTGQAELSYATKIINQEPQGTTETSFADFIEFIGKTSQVPCVCKNGYVTCRECRGFGQVTCDLGHDHDCEDCDSGQAECFECEGGFVLPEPEPVGILSGVYNKHLIAEVVDSLNAETVSLSTLTRTEMDALLIESQNWFVVVAGFKSTPTKVYLP